MWVKWFESRSSHQGHEVAPHRVGTKRQPDGAIPPLDEANSAEAAYLAFNTGAAAVGIARAIGVGGPGGGNGGGAATGPPEDTPGAE